MHLVKYFLRPKNFQIDENFLFKSLQAMRVGVMDMNLKPSKYQASEASQLPENNKARPMTLIVKAMVIVFFGVRGGGSPS